MNRSAIAIPYAKSTAGKEFYLGMLLILTLAFLPIYYFKSGKLQFVDFFIVISIFSVIFRGDKFKQYFFHQIFYILPFVVWVIIVNLSYFSANHDDLGLLKKTIEIIYLMLLTYALIIVFVNLLTMENVKYLYIGLLLSIIMAFLIKGYAEETGPRVILSFNNPNQMGYFGIILLSFAVLLSNISKLDFKIGNDLKTIYIIVIVAAHFFAILSISRAAIGGVLLVDMYFLRNLSWRTLSAMFLAFLLSVVTVLIIRPDFVEKITKLESRINEMDINSRFNKQYNRLVFQNEWQVIVGVGSGKSELNVDGNEIHNLWAAAFRTYGLIGFVLLSIWFVRVALLTRSLDGAVFVGAGLIFFNTFHNGIRFRSLWVLLAFMVALQYVLSRKYNLGNLQKKGKIYLIPRGDDSKSPRRRIF